MVSRYMKCMQEKHVTEKSDPREDIVLSMPHNHGRIGYNCNSGSLWELLSDGQKDQMLLGSFGCLNQSLTVGCTQSARA